MSECTDHFYQALLQNSICVRSWDIDGNTSRSLCKEESVPLILSENLISSMGRGLIGILKKSDGSCKNGALNLFTDVKPYVNWMFYTINIDTGLAIHNATQNQFPYHAHIEVFNHDLISKNKCSGAVITSLFIITSKSCVWSGSYYGIKLGSHNSGKEDDNPAFDHLTRIWPFFPPDHLTGYQSIV